MDKETQMGIEKLQQAIDESNYIVFFGGAGVSTESGIPDFRSQDGLYHQKYKYPPETIVSHTFLMQKQEEFFEFQVPGVRRYVVDHGNGLLAALSLHAARAPVGGMVGPRPSRTRRTPATLPTARPLTRTNTEVRLEY